MLVLRRSAYDAIIDHAIEGQPEEICGVLGGQFAEDRSTVTSVSLATNVSKHPRTEYFMDPEEQLELIDAIEEQGDDVVGFYHSHPAGPTVPSTTDEARATWPGYSYVIAAFDGHPFVGSWRWTGESFDQEVVRVDGL
jgi:proteasome lid subunit RPN8/RPN11